MTGKREEGRGKGWREASYSSRFPLPFSLAWLVVAVFTAACLQPGKGKTAYTGARVFDGTGSELIPDAVIIVSGGRIERVGRRGEVNVPRGATEVSLAGKWVVPGLIDGHTHLERWTLPRFLAYGVTAVRDLGGNLDSLVRLRAEVDEGLTAGPRMYIAGAMIDAAPATWSDARAVESASDARRAVGQMVAANVSQIKAYTRIDREMLRAIVEEARILQVPVTAHLGLVDALSAAQMGVSAIEHLSGVVESAVTDPGPYFRAHDRFFFGWISFERAWANLDPAALDRTARALVATGVTVVPTLVQHETYARLDDAAYPGTLDLSGVPPAVRRRWNIPDLIGRAGLTAADYPVMRRSRPRQDGFVRRFHSQGGRVVAGTDAPNQLIAPGASLHHELALLVRAGLTPREALRAATSNAAALLGADSIGVLRDGAAADFVVLGADPLADIANIRKVEAVVVSGSRFSPDELRQGW